MGYYLCVLQKGEIYDLHGRKLQFVDKCNEKYFFNVCRVDEDDFRYKPTTEQVPFTKEQIFYIKRFEQEPTPSGLRLIGKEKVFPRN